MKEKPQRPEELLSHSLAGTFLLISLAHMGGCGARWHLGLQHSVLEQAAIAVLPPPALFLSLSWSDSPNFCPTDAVRRSGVAAVPTEVTVAEEWHATQKGEL